MSAAVASAESQVLSPGQMPQSDDTQAVSSAQDQSGASYLQMTEEERLQLLKDLPKVGQRCRQENDGKKRFNLLTPIHFEDDPEDPLGDVPLLQFTGSVFTAKTPHAAAKKAACRGHTDIYFQLVGTNGLALIHHFVGEKRPLKDHEKTKYSVIIGAKTKSTVKKQRTFRPSHRIVKKPEDQPDGAPEEFKRPKRIDWKKIEYEKKRAAAIARGEDPPIRRKPRATAAKKRVPAKKGKATGAAAKIGGPKGGVSKTRRATTTGRKTAATKGAKTTAAVKRSTAKKAPTAAAARKRKAAIAATTSAKGSTVTPARKRTKANNASSAGGSASSKMVK